MERSRAGLTLNDGNPGLSPTPGGLPTPTPDRSPRWNPRHPPALV